MISSLLVLMLYLLVIGLIVWLVWYIADMIPLPPPFNRLVKMLAVIVGVLIVIVVLLHIVGGVETGLPRLM